MLDVTCALIEVKGKILVVQRGPSMKMPGKWEFPGGKKEAGESLRDCLKREILEELDLNITVGESLQPVSHNYGKGLHIRLFPFLCTPWSNSIHLHEHSEFRWVRREELSSLDWSEADIPVYEKYYLN